MVVFYLSKMKNKIIKILAISLAFIGLTFAFVFQNIDVLCMCQNPHGFYHYNPNEKNILSFVLNKILRFFINTFSSIILVFYIFNKPSLTKNSILVQLLLLVLFMPLFLYFSFSSYSVFNNLSLKLNAIIINPVILFLVCIIYYFNNKNKALK